MYPTYTVAERLLKPIGLAFILLLPLGRFQPAEARDLRLLTTLEAANLSARISLARCLAVEVREGPGGNIFTFSEFEVLQMAKGSLPAHFTLRLLGGRLGNVEVDAPYLPRFTPGEEVVLFLGRDNADGYPTIFPQGVFAIRTHPMSGEKVVVPSPTGLSLFHVRDNTPYPVPPKYTPLEDFLFSLEKLERD